MLCYFLHQIFSRKNIKSMSSYRFGVIGRINFSVLKIVFKKFRDRTNLLDHKTSPSGLVMMHLVNCCLELVLEGDLLEFNYSLIMFTKHNTDQHIFLFYVKLVIHMINFKIFPVSFMQVFHTIRHI